MIFRSYFGVQNLWGQNKNKFLVVKQILGQKCVGSTKMLGVYIYLNPINNTNNKLSSILLKLQSSTGPSDDGIIINCKFSPYMLSYAPLILFLVKTLHRTLYSVFVYVVSVQFLLQTQYHKVHIQFYNFFLLDVLLVHLYL